MKSKRGSPCDMCNFAFSSGDTKYVVEHWMARKEKEGKYDEDGVGFGHRVRGDNDDDDEMSGIINWDAPSREHLCPECAVSRGLDYDKYYKQNQNNATSKSKQETPLTASAYRHRRRRALLKVKNNNNSNKKQRVDDDDDDDQDSTVTSKRISSSGNNDKLRLDSMAKKLSSSSNNSIKACSIRPHPECPLFVAWNGVIVLVYDGFPPSLIKAKERLSSCSMGGNTDDDDDHNP